MDNPLKKFSDAVTGFFKSSAANSESVVGIDIGTSSIKVVQLRNKGGKAVLETYGELSLGSYAGAENGELTNLPNDKLAAALIETIKDSEITAKSAAVSIPSASSLIFTVEIPAAVSEKDIAGVIATEARKFIPVPINEVSLDWWIIPRREEYTMENEVKKEIKTEVLVAAVHKDTLARYMEILKLAGLQSDTFEIEIWSSIRSSFGHEVSPVLLLDFGASKAKLSIVDNGIVRVFHLVNRGSYDITSGIAKSLNLPFSRAEEMKRTIGLAGSGADQNIADTARLSVDYILSESAAVVLSYEKKYNKAISKVVLTGGGALLKGFADVAAGTFRSEVFSADPFSKTETPAFLGDILKGIGPEFSVACGLALRKLK
jgi:type IV pilus assembly protein PilM